LKVPTVYRCGRSLQEWENARGGPSKASFGPKEKKSGGDWNRRALFKGERGGRKKRDHSGTRI